MTHWIKFLVLSVALVLTPTSALAQTDEWFVGSHPEYHAAMIRDIDGIFVAIYVAKEPSRFGSPLLMETVYPACGTSKPVEMHSTRAIMAVGETAQERLVEVRETVEFFLERATSDCSYPADLEARFFHRFDAAYLATDALLVEAGIFPLDLDASLGGATVNVVDASE